MSCSLGRGRGAKRSPTARVTAYSYNGNQPWPTHSPIYPPLLSYNQRLKALCFSYSRSLFATTSNKPGFETMFLYSGSGGVLPVFLGPSLWGKAPSKIRPESHTVGAPHHATLQDPTLSAERQSSCGVWMVVLASSSILPPSFALYGVVALTYLF